MDLGSLRARLADAEIAVREASDALGVEKARSEQRAADAAGGTKGLGANEDERKRALTLALADDRGYQEALRRLRSAEADRDRQAVQLEAARDARRAQEWAIRLRLADAIFRLPMDGEPDDTGAFDAGLDEALDRALPATLPAAAPRGPARNRPVPIDEGSLDDLYEPKVGGRPPLRRNQPVSAHEEYPF